MSVIVSCPVCGEDLIDEAFTWWCEFCERAVPYSEVIVQGDPDE
jgi:hypothetical protein